MITSPDSFSIIEKFTELLNPFSSLITPLQNTILTGDITCLPGYTLNSTDKPKSLYYPSGWYHVDFSSIESWNTGTSNIYVTLTDQESRSYEYTISYQPFENSNGLKTAIVISAELGRNNSLFRENNLDRMDYEDENQYTTENTLSIHTECDLKAIDETLESPIKVDPAFLFEIKSNLPSNARFREYIEAYIDETGIHYDRIQKVSFSNPIQARPGEILTIEYYSFNGVIAKREIIHKANVIIDELTSPEDIMHTYLIED